MASLSFLGLENLIPKIKENIPKLSKSIFSKKEGLSLLADELVAPKTTFASQDQVYANMHSDEIYYQDDNGDPSNSQVDLDELYSILSDWPARENLGEMELPPTAVEALNCRTTDQDVSKISRRGGGVVPHQQQHTDFTKEFPSEQRFSHPNVQDAYYNLPKSF